ncbi:MAG: sigma 54-interacting transcriptional regulator [Syntrophobacteraceae bacterium]|jgi:PAS domain S-box-containing protein|nr:sigma 54-interacting transcriptional regulator [Syntrophobacteraceae bacterium]
MDNNLLETLVATMQDGLLVVDTEGRILAVNAAFLEMTGYTSAELVGKPCTVLNCTGCEIYGEKDGHRFCALFEKGAVRNRRCGITARDGHTVHVVKSATVLHDQDGRVVSAVETLNNVSELVRREEEIQSLRLSLYQEGYASGIVGNSRSIQALLALVGNAAHSDAPVFISGESGVGKELVARALHDLSPRARRSFIKVNCASLNENLLESELFGHVKGSFTGAARDRIGRFEAATGGTIFLDEIGDLSPSIQVKLLRVLECGEVERVGDHNPVQMDARVITATNRDLEALVHEGSFRADLFYRINVVPIHVPALRERREDIPLLAQHFIERIAARSGKPIRGLTTEALEVLLAHPWPGNIRELRNTIEYAFVLCHDGLIRPEHLGARVLSASGACDGKSAAPAVERVRCVERHERSQREDAVRRALEASRGNRTEAAKLLGISRVALWKRMKRLGIL